jgi:hypothetical protein
MPHASLTDTGVVEITDEQLQAMFDESIPCDLPNCTGDATWRVWAVPCMCEAYMCAYHKMRELAKYKMETEGARCHKNRSILVTDLKAEPL